VKYLFILILIVAGSTSIGIGIFGEGTFGGAATALLLSVAGFIAVAFMEDDGKK
jgi:hypothetical protein